MTNHQESEKFIVSALKEVFQKIVSMNGRCIHVEYKPTDYVTTGGLFQCSSPDFSTQIWVGLNGPRFFFIVYVDGQSAEEARNTFKFSFAGAKRLGWDFSFEKIDEESLSIWGTLMTDKSIPLVTSKMGALSHSFDLTQEGHFWLTDIGMMAQSFIRTCERNKITSPSDKSAAPL